jgi:hypothetical protein
MYGRKIDLHIQENHLNTRKRSPRLAALLFALLALSSCVTAPTPLAAPATPATVEPAAAPQAAPTAEPTAAPAVVEITAVPFDLGDAVLM